MRIDRVGFSDGRGSPASGKTDLATKLTEVRQLGHFPEREPAGTKDPLEEAGDVDRALNEFSAQPEGVENMKKQYIRTIRTLKLQLRDARSTIRALSGEDPDNELTALPGRTAATTPPAPKNETPEQKENDNAVERSLGHLCGFFVKFRV